MNGLARPAEWLGRQGRLGAASCASAGAALLLAAAAAWETRPPAGASAAWLAVAALLVPLGAALGAVLACAGAACLLRPQGRLAMEGQRLLEEAARHHAEGGLSSEGLQATRERIHAQAASRAIPQVALTLSLAGASLAVLAVALAGRFLALAQGPSLPGVRTALALTGVSVAATLAGALLVLRQAAAWRARARADACALQQMLADLEQDILDEVRRSSPHVAAEAGGQVAKVLPTTNLLK
ncbi:MAG TPA: hypothetical protein VHI93_01045 [Candidatus Thermoplasmatota archaeon]|nr:hypothetical protein [Candidatus Thermoplasmatota archaeon]